jgi:PKD repeat protein
MKKLYFLLVILTLSSSLVFAQVADFTVSTYSGCSPLVISIYNNSTSSVTYLWDFGDGYSNSTSSKDSLQHVYVNSAFVTKNFIIKLIAFNSDSTSSDTMTSTIQVYPEVTSHFTTSADSGCTPLYVLFQNSSIGGSIFTWDFGDSTTSNNFNPAHVFLNKSYRDTLFYVSMIGKNIYSCTDTFNRSIKIYAKVKSDFSLDTTQGISPFEINPINKSIGGVVYKWDFGDGTTTSEMNPSHLYINNTSKDTIYQLTLVTTNSHLCIDSSFGSIKVLPTLNDLIGKAISINTVYPIPFIDILNIESKSSIEKIEVYNLQGVLIYSLKMNGIKQCQVNLSNLEPNNYLIEIKGEKFIDYRRVIKY